MTFGQRIGKARRALNTRGSGGMLPRKILKFYGHRDVFSYILKLQTMTFNNQKKTTFLDNLIMIKLLDEVRQTNIWRDEEFSPEGESQKY